MFVRLFSSSLYLFFNSQYLSLFLILIFRDIHNNNNNSNSNNNNCCTFLLSSSPFSTLSSSPVLAIAHFSAPPRFLPPDGLVFFPTVIFL